MNQTMQMKKDIRALLRDLDVGSSRHLLRELYSGAMTNTKNPVAQLKLGAHYEWFLKLLDAVEHLDPLSDT